MEEKQNISLVSIDKFYEGLNINDIVQAFVAEKDKVLFDYMYNKYLNLSKTKKYNKDKFIKFMTSNADEIRKSLIFNKYIPYQGASIFKLKDGDGTYQCVARIWLDSSGKFLSLDEIQELIKKEKDISEIFMCDDERFKKFLEENE